MPTTNFHSLTRIFIPFFLISQIFLKIVIFVVILSFMSTLMHTWGCLIIQALKTVKIVGVVNIFSPYIRARSELLNRRIVTSQNDTSVCNDDSESLAC